MRGLTNMSLPKTGHGFCLWFIFVPFSASPAHLDAGELLKVPHSRERWVQFCSLKLVKVSYGTGGSVKCVHISLSYMWQLLEPYQFLMVLHCNKNI